MPYDAVVYQMPFANQALGMSLVISLMFWGILILVLTQKESHSLHGDARFAKDNEIKKAGLFDSDGIIVGKYKNKILRYGGNQFVAVQSPTRSGKGVAIVQPNLLTWTDSSVVLDIKQECFNITSKYRQDHLKNKVFLFDPFSYRTHRYNPLGYIDFDKPTAEIDLNNLASILFPSVGKDPFWSDNAKILFCGIVYFLKDLIDNNLTELKMNLNSVLRLKDGHSDLSLIDFYNSIKEIEETENRTIITDRTKKNLIKFFSITSENTSSIITGVFDSTLSIFGIDVIANATSDNDFDLRRLRMERITIYLGITPPNLIQASKLVNLFFSQLILENTKQLPQDNPDIKYKCLVLMDEFTSIGYMSVILKGCAFIAGYWLRLLLVYQSKSQLCAPEPIGYGVTGGKTLTDNCACNLIFTPKQDDAKEYSDTLGYQTVKNKSKSRSKSGESRSESDTRRPLMLPQELRDMPFEQEIIMIDSIKPILCKKAFYYSEPEILNRLKAVSPTIASIDGNNVPQHVFERAFQLGETRIEINKCA